jgi:hypothetical protein
LRFLGLVAFVSVAVLVAAILLRIVIRAGRDDPSLAGDMVTLTVVICVLIFAVAIAAVTTTVRRLTKRVEYLDGLTEEGLRQETARDKWSFRVTAADASDVSIDPLESANVLGAKQGEAAARLTFTHDDTGTWKLNLVTAKDTRAAVRAFRRLLGRGKVEVTVPLEGD